MEQYAPVNPSLVPEDDYSDPWEGILELYLESSEEATPILDVEDEVSDEELERQIVELTLEVEMHDANIGKLKSGIADLDAKDAALGQVEDGLAAAERVADKILVTLAGHGWENVEEGEKGTGEAVEV